MDGTGPLFSGRPRGFGEVCRDRNRRLHIGLNAVLCRQQSMATHCAAALDQLAVGCHRDILVDIGWIALGDVTDAIARRAPYGVAHPRQFAQQHDCLGGSRYDKTVRGSEITFPDDKRHR